MANFYLQIQRIEQTCCFQLSWGNGQQLNVTIPYPKNLSIFYQDWQRAYLSYYKQYDNKTELRGRIVDSGTIETPNVDLHAKLVQTEAKLLSEFHNWLRGGELYEIRAEIAKFHNSSVNSEVTVDIFLTCNTLELERLPWEAWEIGAEFSISLAQIRFVRKPLNIHHGLKITNRHQQNLAIAKQIGDKAGEGRALGNLGIAYRNLGDYQKAIEFHQQDLAIAKQIGDKAGEGRALGNLGMAYRSLGDYQKAIEYLQQSLAIFKQIGDKAGEGNALGNLGIAYDSLRDYQKAIEFHQQHFAIAKQIGDKAGEGSALGNLGIAYRNLGDYQKVIEFNQQSLAVAKQIGDKAGEGRALGSLGAAYDSLGDYQKAIEFHQQLLVITKQIGDKAGEGLALNNLGLTLFKSGNLAEAQKVLKQGIEVWKSQHSRQGKDEFKISIFEEQARTYRTLQQVYIAQNQPDAALEVAESGRARAFVDLLASRLNITSTEPTIDQIKQIAKAQNSTLVQYSIIYDEFKINGKPQTKESKLYIWVIKPTGEIIFRKADLKGLWQKENTTLAQLVDNTRDSMGVIDIITRRHGGLKPKKPEGNTQTNQTQNLKQLHKLLIQPIAKYLPNNPNEKVIFIPQESLFLVSFPALQDGKGKYLIEKHTILTAPSIQVLDLTRQQKVEKQKQKDTSTGQSLIVGNPTMPITSLQPGGEKTKLPPLKGAEKEAKTIASLPLLNSKPLIGDAATETAVVAKMFQVKYIHLATHGLFDDIRGLGSAIALAPSQQDDGLLTAEEIFNFQQKFNQKLNAYLVVLSACDTGRGRITGDGVIGLSRSFISAGVPSVIVSLWSVDDGSTAFLMTKFYQNLERNPDKAKALREAMLETKKQYSQPLQWAAFTLIGESE